MSPTHRNSLIATPARQLASHGPDADDDDDDDDDDELLSSLLAVTTFPTSPDRKSFTATKPDNHVWSRSRVVSSTELVSGQRSVVITSSSGRRRRDAGHHHHQPAFC